MTTDFTRILSGTLSALAGAAAVVGTASCGFGPWAGEGTKSSALGDSECVCAEPMNGDTEWEGEDQWEGEGEGEGEEDEEDCDSDHDSDNDSDSDSDSDSSHDDADSDGDGRVTICHSTGSLSNPYDEITVSVNALDAHARHHDGADIIPAPAEGCPGMADAEDCVCVGEGEGEGEPAEGEGEGGEGEGTCDADATMCGGYCVVLAWDAWNCGACGTVCAEGQACVDSVCQ